MIATELQNKQRFGNLGHQYLAAVVGNIVFLGHGAMNGWLSPSLPELLSSEETPLKTGPLTNEELSWVGSINSIGAILGTFTFGFFTMQLGCKRTMLFLTLPSILFWVLIYIGDTYYHLLIARFATGWTGGGVQTTIILYISEISNDEIRGKLGSLSQLIKNIGILLSYVLGTFITYKTIPCIFVFIPIIFGITFYFLPNTPQYYLRNFRVKEAEASLRWYKNCNNSSNGKGNNVNEEIAFNAEFERLKLIANERKSEGKIRLKDICNRQSLKGLMNGIVLATLFHLNGSLVFVTYAVVIFEEAGASPIDPNISSITIAVMQIIGTLCTTNLCDTLGRKILLIISLSGSALGLFSFALYSFLHHHGYELSSFGWVPVTTLGFVIFISSAGIIPLIFLCTVEMLPAKIRTVGLTICNVWLNVTSFVCLKLFPSIMAVVGLDECMLTFGIACTLGAVYVHFIMDETKGVSMDSVHSNQKNHNENNSSES